MSTALQARLRDGEPEYLRTDVADLVDVWAATLLDVPRSELAEHPDADVALHRLTACALLIGEIGDRFRQLERDARDAGCSQPVIAVARGVTHQAVSARLRASGSKANGVAVAIAGADCNSA